MEIKYINLNTLKIWLNSTYMFVQAFHEQNSEVCVLNQLFTVKAHESSHKSVSSLVKFDSQWVGSLEDYLAIQCVHSSSSILFFVEVDVSWARKRIHIHKLNVGVWFLHLYLCHRAIFLEQLIYIILIECHWQFLNV